MSFIKMFLLWYLKYRVVAITKRIYILRDKIYQLIDIHDVTIDEKTKASIWAKTNRLQEKKIALIIKLVDIRLIIGKIT